MSKQRNELREEMKLVTANLDERWVKAAAAEVCKNLCDLIDTRLHQQVEHILAYQPLQPGSVDLSNFVSQQIKLGRNVYIPCGNKDNFTFFDIKPDALEKLELKSLAAINCQSIVDAPFATDSAQHTVILMPGLAYDLQGNRIGWGKLHYEHLSRKPGMRSVIKIGVCWELQVQSAVPAGNTDLLVDWLVHERAAIQTGVEFQTGQELDFD